MKEINIKIIYIFDVYSSGIVLQQSAAAKTLINDTDFFNVPTTSIYNHRAITMIGIPGVNNSNVLIMSA